MVTRHCEGATAMYLLAAGGGPEVRHLGTHINLLLRSCPAYLRPIQGRPQLVSHALEGGLFH